MVKEGFVYFTSLLKYIYLYLLLLLKTDMGKQVGFHKQYKARYVCMITMIDDDDMISISSYRLEMFEVKSTKKIE